MMQAFGEFVTTINGWAWGPVMLVLLLGTGLYLSIGLRFLTLRNIPRAFRLLFSGRGGQGQGDISPFSALMTSLSATIGTGNIAGVATALVLGGPGALFWMWITALVGMATKYAEAVCAVRFREQDAAGNYSGGPMYYIRNGLHQRWHWLAWAFAIFGTLAGFGIANTVQSNSVSQVLEDFLAVPPLATGLVLMCLVAGGLHWFFYMRHGQGKRLKYDARPLMTKGRQFHFGGQVRDNMFWSLTSGVGFWTGYEVLMFWAMANGWAPHLSWAGSPVWFVLLFPLTPVWISFHFYWIHRALHWGPLYRLAHGLHHRNVNVGPWSGLSMHPVEHLMFFSSVLIHVIVPAHPLHILFHMQHQALTAATSHTGYESLLVKDRQALALGTFHHQMHHRYFEVNYGNLEVPWDKWFGSFHDGTAEAHERLKSRRGRPG